MATGSILLPIEAATLPDGSAGNAAAQIQRHKSSAAAPSPHWMEALFDEGTDEMLMWSFRMPQNYSSGPIAKIQYKMASAVSGAVVFEVRLMAVSDGDAQDIDADSFATTNTSATTTVPATAGYLDEISVTLTNADSIAAGDFVIVYLRRDSDNAADNAAGDVEVIAFSLEYTTT